MPSGRSGVFDISLWLVFLVILGGLKDHLKEIKRCKRLMVIGCGTSFHAAVAVSQRCTLVLKSSYYLVIRMFGVHFQAFIFSNKTVIASCNRSGFLMFRPGRSLKS